MKEHGGMFPAKKSSPVEKYVFLAIIHRQRVTPSPGRSIETSVKLVCLSGLPTYGHVRIVSVNVLRTAVFIFYTCTRPRVRGTRYI